MRIRELEQENIQLNREVEELRRQLEARNARLRPDIDHRHHGFAPYDDRHFDREAKRRRPMMNQDEPFLVSDEQLLGFSTACTDLLTPQIANTQLPSPPLSTASSLTPYSHTTSATMTQQRSPTATTPMTSYSMPYPMPETPSSSTASSPSTTSFSASVPSFLPLCHAQEVYGMNYGS